MDVNAVSAASSGLQGAPAAADSPHASAEAATAARRSAPGDPALAAAIAKLFAGDQPSSLQLSVSYRVTHNPNEIVTVFSDPATGKEIAQFPAEMLVQMAEFFDKHAGVTLDKTV